MRMPPHLAAAIARAQATKPRRKPEQIAIAIAEDRGPRRPLTAPARVEYPLRVVSESNARGHWGGRAGRTKDARGLAQMILRSHLGAAPLDLPLVVSLTRIAPRALDDDNLRGALKATRDGIADYLDVDDRSPLVTWDYAQERGPKRTHLVRIEIAPRSSEAT